MKPKYWFVIISALAILTLAAPLAWATTYHTITVDGDMSDWATDEDMETVGPYTLYLTWDAANIYLGLTGAYLGDDPNQDKSFFVCFDTDLIPGSGAPADGYGNVSFNINFLAPEYCYYFAGGAGWYEWSIWNNVLGHWVWQPWRNDGTFYHWPGNPASFPGSEMTIQRSDIGNPSAVGVVAWLTPEQPIPGPVEAAWPTPNPTGTSPTFYRMYYFPSLGDGISPDTAVSTVLINEIRIDQPSTDNDEYFELIGPPGASLDGLTYLVIGDGTGGSGVIEEVTNLTGNTIPASGFFVVAESTFSLGTADLVTTLNFENEDNVTHLLVSGFTGSDGQDLDTNNDGILDVAPWAQVIDLIALIKEENPPVTTEYHYGPPTVGPDGSYVPGHAYRCATSWLIGQFDPVGGDDTPNEANNCQNDVSVQKTGPALVSPGGYITYTITYGNEGSIAATGAIISDTLPTDVFYIDDNSNLPCPACIPGATGTLTWYVGTLEPASFVTFSLTTQVSETVPPGIVLTNTIEITATGDVNPANNTDRVTTTIVGSEIGIAKLCPADPLLPGQIVTYTLSYNALGEPAQNVIITDLLPVDVTYLSDNSGITPIQPTTGTLVWDMGTLTDSGSFVITAVISTNPMTWTFTNQAWISATNDSLPGNNYDACSNQGPRPISAIQYATDPGGDGTYPSPYLGEYAYTLGYVTAGSNTYGTPNTRYIIKQGSGPWSGLLVYNGGNHPPVSEGDLVLLGGQVNEYYGMTELDIRNSVGGYQQVLSSGNPLVVDKVTTADITPGQSLTSEQWEAVLIEVNCAEVTSEPDQYGEWGASDASGEEAVIGDWTSYPYTPTLGDQLAWIRGVLFYSYGRYVLEPRADADLALAPQVVAVSPEPDAEVCADTALTVQFDTEMDPASVEEAFTLVGPAGPVEVDFGYDPATWTAAFTPTAPLPPGSLYTAILTTTATTPDGVPLCAPYEWSFSTASAPEVSFTAPLTACVDTPVQFTGAVDGGLAPFTYLWTFGDGGTADTLSASHTYVQTGTFDVILAVSDACGLEAEFTAPIIIEECAVVTKTFIYLPIVVKGQ